VSFPATFVDLMAQGRMHNHYDQYHAAWTTYLRAAERAPDAQSQDLALAYAAFAFERDPTHCVRLEAAAMDEKPFDKPDPTPTPQGDGDPAPLSESTPHDDDAPQ
jgi:hypothetical protein